jgi:hypothetical protein
MRRISIARYIRRLSNIVLNLSWSSDGVWITSVNHHYLRNHKLSHVKVINTKDLDSPQILIGHEFPVFIAVSFIYIEILESNLF